MAESACETGAEAGSTVSATWSAPPSWKVTEAVSWIGAGVDGAVAVTV
ncbi:MAG: hypothetical protein LBL55_03835 [Propionibacteriaceae bacterium]|nr:hypothetical protein [Propionibacteriaceae bacterium]